MWYLICANSLAVALLAWRVHVLTKLANKRFEAVARAHQRGM